MNISSLLRICTNHRSSVDINLPVKSENGSEKSITDVFLRGNTTQSSAHAHEVRELVK